MADVAIPQSLCNFGFARCDITPPVGIYHRMWGASVHDRSEGVHRPLSASAMVFRARDANPACSSEQVLIAVDHCLLGTREMAGILNSVCERNGLERQQVTVTFSHTHAAGLMSLDRVDLPGGDSIPDYLDAMGSKIANAVHEARNAVGPVTITYAVGRCSLAANRDFFDEERGEWVCGFNPNQPADDNVLVARITNARHDHLATIVNYACHPTTLAWDNRMISPDYPGATRAIVELITGAPCIFLQGVSGDVGPREGFVGDVDVADRNGRQLGFAALEALQAMPPPQKVFRYKGPVVSGATIGTWSHEPPSDNDLARLQQFRVRRWPVDLPYRHDLPTLEATNRERDRWLAAEAAARSAGNDAGARECRAMVERSTRALVRLRDLPEGNAYPYPVVLWQMGAAVWLAVEGEPYQLLQTELRRRFPDVAIVVSVLANGSRCSYLPTADCYGKRLYQVQIAILAKGALEKLIDAVAAQISAWLEDAA